MTEVDNEFLEIFRDEANERLDSIVDVLLALESGRADPDAVDALFRDAHTIKGAAAMIGLDDVRTLAHTVEDVLDAVREAGTFPPDLADPLLRAADALRRQVAGTGEAPAALVEELAASRARIVAAGTTTDGEVARDRTRPDSDQRSIRVPPAKLDRVLDLVGETVLHRRRLEHALGETATDELEPVSDELAAGDRLLDDLKEAAIGMRTLPLASIVGPYPRAVRDLASEQRKEVDLVVAGAETELDRVILEALSEPLVHLLRNAVGHGVELPEERERAGKPRRATVRLRAEQRGGLVEITVSDDGRGVSREALAEARKEGSLADVLARPGFSTASEVTELSGRGVGLHAVKKHVESFGGNVEVRSEPGRGTDVVLLLPLSLALLEVLLVERGGQAFGIPLASVEEAIAVDKTVALGGRPALELRGASVSLADLAVLVGADAPPLHDRAPAVVVSASGRRIAALCDRLLGQEEVVVKRLGRLLDGVSGYMGAAILGDGTIALLLDPTSLVRAPRRTAPQTKAAPRNGAGRKTERRAPKVLVVEDSFTVRELQRSILEAAGYRVETARDGRDALDRLSRDDDVNLVLTDVEMPEMDGIALTETIRRQPEHSSLPVVIVTSRGSEDDRRRGIEAGADAYMAKRSFDQQALLETIERLVGR